MGGEVTFAAHTPMVCFTKLLEAKSVPYKRKGRYRPQYVVKVKQKEKSHPECGWSQRADILYSFLGAPLQPASSQ